MKKILFVEDDDLFIKTSAFFFTRKGYSVRVARGEDDAINKIKEKEPDIILLDIILKEEDGIMICKNLKNNPISANIPILMITVKGYREDIENAIKAGADGYITKPLSLSRLLGRVEELLTKYGKN